jgi:hypothetical protein
VVASASEPVLASAPGPVPPSEFGPSPAPASAPDPDDDPELELPLVDALPLEEVDPLPDEDVLEGPPSDSPYCQASLPPIEHAKAVHARARAAGPWHPKGARKANRKAASPCRTFICRLWTEPIETITRDATRCSTPEAAVFRGPR